MAMSASGWVGSPYRRHGLALGVARSVLRRGYTQMIVGGHPAAEGKYPWQVRLYSNMDDKIGFCGGSS